MDATAKRPTASDRQTNAAKQQDRADTQRERQILQAPGCPGSPRTEPLPQSPHRSRAERRSHGVSSARQAVSAGDSVPPDKPATPYRVVSQEHWRTPGTGYRRKPRTGPRTQSLKVAKVTRPSTKTSATTATRCDGTCHPSWPPAAPPSECADRQQCGHRREVAVGDHHQHHHPARPAHSAASACQPCADPAPTSRPPRTPGSNAVRQTRHWRRGAPHRQPATPSARATTTASAHDTAAGTQPRMPPQPQHNQLSPPISPAPSTGHPPRRLIHPLKLPLGLPRDRSRNVLGDRLKTLRGSAGNSRKASRRKHRPRPGTAADQRPRIRPAQLIGLLGVEHRRPLCAIPH